MIFFQVILIWGFMGDSNGKMGIDNPKTGSRQNGDVSGYTYIRISLENGRIVTSTMGIS